MIAAINERQKHGQTKLKGEARMCRGRERESERNNLQTADGKRERAKRFALQSYVKCSMRNHLGSAAF